MVVVGCVAGASAVAKCELCALALLSLVATVVDERELRLYAI